MYDPIIETLITILSHCTTFLLIRTYFMKVFYMTYVKNTTFHKLKNQQTRPVYEDKSDTGRNVVIIRGTLSETLCSEQFLPKFNIVLCYIIVGR